MAGENEMKIIFGADTSPLQSEVSKASEKVEQFGEAVKKAATESEKGFDRLKKSTEGVVKAFDAAAASAEAMKRISARIDEMADAAIKSNRRLEDFGVTPMFNLKRLDDQIRTVKATLASGFKPAINQIKIAPTNTSIVSLSDAFERYKKNVAKSKVEVDALNASLARTGSAFRGTATGTNAASLALNDLSRIAQDVPFGFIGIQNNLNPMLESFRRLKTEAGSTRGALASLFSSLTGFGGIGLAVGVISSAFTIYQNGVAGFNRSQKEAKEETDSFKDSVDAAASSVAQEASRVAQLVGVIENETSTKKARNAAVEELKRINPNYFGQLKEEKGLVENVGLAYQGYVQNLVRAAQSKIFEKKLEALLDRKIQLGLEIDPNNPGNVVAIAKSQAEEAADAFRDAYNIGDSVSDSIKVPDANGAMWDQYGNFIGKEVKKGFVEAKPFFDGKQFKKEAQAVDAEIKFVLDKLKELNQFQPTDNTEKTKKEVDLIRQRISALKELIDAGIDVKQNTLELRGLEIKLLLRDGKKEGFTADEIEQLIYQKMFPADDIKLARPLMVTVPVQATIQEAINEADPAGDNLEGSIQRTYDKIVKAAEAARKKLEVELAKPMQGLVSSINGAMVDAFAAVGNALGDLISGQDPLAGFLNFIASALDQLGKALIAFAIAEKLAIDSLTLGPKGWAVALGAGIAAIAAGKLIKTQLSKRNKFADGGLVMGPTVGMVGEAGPELIIPLNRANQFLDGGNSTNISGELTVRGQDLVLAYSRASGSQQRKR
jgi:hypothetical protein